MKFPVVLHTDDGLNFGVIVPDVAGCFSAGEGIDDALESTQEALALHFESLVADGDPLPKPSPLMSHKDNPDYADGVWAYVDFDIEPYLGGFERVNITLPRLVVREIDRRYSNRSSFLAGLARKEMGLL